MKLEEVYRLGVPHGARIHDLKTDTHHFAAIWRGDKTAEVRRDDRGFDVGHFLHLREIVRPSTAVAWPADPTGEYAITGRAISARISHILRDSPYLQPGHVVLSLADPVNVTGDVYE